MPSPTSTPLLPVVLSLLMVACTERTDHSSAYGGGSRPSGQTAAATRGSLRGHMQLEGADPSDYDCVFVIGRRSADAEFPELVTRLPAGPFPLTFEITARDLMGVGSLRGEWHLTARLDADGDAPAGKGDWEGSAVAQVDANGGFVEITLDTEVLEDGPALASLDPRAGLHGVPTGSAPPLGTQAAHGGLPFGHPDLGAPAAADPHAGHDHAPGAHPVTADGPRIEMRVDVAPELAAEAGGVLFVFVRASATARGMPIAVKRIDSPTFPVTIVLTADDVPLAVDNKAEMLMGTLYATASLDADGNVGTKDGLTSEITPVTAGDAAVPVIISSRRTP